MAAPLVPRSSYFPAHLSPTIDPQNARDAAEAQFDRAQAQRASVEATPESNRTLVQYQELVNPIVKSYLLSASAKDVPQAIMIVGDLNRKMGDFSIRNIINRD